jgi:hypothetical protein
MHMRSRLTPTLLLLALLLTTANAGSQMQNPYTDVRAEARRLADDYVRTATTTHLNDLAFRTAAFAGLVPKTQVTLDDRMHPLDRVLMDSANTLLGMHTPEEDAQAVRNIVYALDEVAKGHTRAIR